MTRLTCHIRHNVVAYLALFVALGGTSYAAISLPRNSVGNRQLKNGAVTPAKLNGKDIAGSVRAWAVIDATGAVVSSGGHPTAMADNSIPGAITIRWKTHFTRVCATSATIDRRSAATETVAVPGSISQPLTAGYATANSGSTADGTGETTVETFNQLGQPTPLAFDVAVVC